MARVFYHRPRFAIMDEATSSFDAELERKVLHSCKALGITMVGPLHLFNGPKFLLAI